MGISIALLGIEVFIPFIYKSYNNSIYIIVINLSNICCIFCLNMVLFLSTRNALNTNLRVLNLQGLLVVDSAFT